MTNTLTALTSLLASTLTLAQVPTPASVPIPIHTRSPTTAPATAPSEQSVELGKRVSGMWDVSFQPFKDARQIDRMVPAEILRFAQDKNQWSLVFDKADLGEPIPLADTRTAAGVDQPGYLTAATNLIRSNDPAAEIFRTEVLDTGELKIGVIVAHVRIQDKHALMQQALIEVTPRLYYSIVMHAPAPETDFEKSPKIAEAANVFKAIVDSIEPVDLSAIREDQENRLFRTRALFVNWNKKALLAALRPEQFLRLRRQTPDGKWEDIGYAYSVEQPASNIPRAKDEKSKEALPPELADGIRVGMRMRSFPDAGKTVDVESWMYVAFDRRHEIWSNVTVARDPGSAVANEREAWMSEVGATDVEKERVFNQELRAGDFKEVDRLNEKGKAEGAKEEFVPFREVEKYKMIVRTESRNAVATPLQRVLPPFYLPQAMGTILPRLLPLNNPTGYLFASYASETRQVMLRYIDVEHEQNVTFNDKTVRAVPVVERLGFDGSKTTHYLSPSGEYLGTLSDDPKLQIVPTTREELLNMWRDADLTAPSETKS